MACCLEDEDLEFFVGLADFGAEPLGPAAPWSECERGGAGVAGTADFFSGPDAFSWLIPWLLFADEKAVPLEAQGRAR